MIWILSIAIASITLLRVGLNKSLESSLQLGRPNKAPVFNVTFFLWALAHFENRKTEGEGMEGKRSETPAIC